uniref:hypothetical protein n=1 Tax=Serratia proteamaculans TaxID=28151 RepID=UPI001F4C2CA1|nr:hypothetical protein [Serratia proteamaculans]
MDIFAVALVVATQVVPKEKSAGAAAKVFAGVAIGLVLGVPLCGTFIDDGVIGRQVVVPPRT